MNISLFVKGYGEFKISYLAAGKKNKEIFSLTDSLNKNIGKVCIKFLTVTKQLHAIFFIDLKLKIYRTEVFIKIIETVTSFVFANPDCLSLQTSNLIKDDFDYGSALDACGYLSSQKKYIHNRESCGLFSISKMVINEKSRLLPNDTDLTQELMNRVGPLWYQYASKGINLSEGGISRSLLTLKQLKENRNLQTFSMYRSDRNSVAITDDMIKRFLIEEKAISTSVKLKEISSLFCYGAHEGIARVARCIYNQTSNNGIFWGQGSYGLLAAALKGIAPVGFQIHLVEVDPKRGERLSLKSLEEFFIAFPNSKTLFLELKSVAGAVYTISELSAIIKLCKKYGIFLLVDAAHQNLHFYKEMPFADIVSLFQKLNYHEYAVIHTASKVYGLERGRVGFILLSQFIKSTDAETVLVELYRNIGAGFDLPYELASALMNAPISERRKFISECQQTLRYNMNLMLAYVEGVDSANIDEDLVEPIKSTVGVEYQRGIKGIKLVYKPQAGVQLKIDMKGISQRFFYNIQMFNSEIFCYVLNKVMGVVTLHSYCLLNYYPYSMRLSFAFREDVSKGMEKICDFIKLLTDVPKMNRNLPNVPDVKSYLEVCLTKTSKSAENSKIGNNIGLFKNCEQKISDNHKPPSILRAKL